MFEHPLITGAVIVAAYAAGVAAGVGKEMNRVALLALPLALLVTLVNPLVYSEGDTLLVRGGEFLGRRWDVTLEALAAGGMAGLRVAAVVMALGLLSATVDPDALLRLFRRVSYRSALSAALAVRLVPVLAARRGPHERRRPLPRRAAPAAAGGPRGAGRRAGPRGRRGRRARGARLRHRVAPAAGAQAVVAPRHRGGGSGGGRARRHGGRPAGRRRGGRACIRRCRSSWGRPSWRWPRGWWWPPRRRCWAAPRGMGVARA